MSASIETGFGNTWSRNSACAAQWDELPTDGSHAWLGLMLLLGSSVLAVRGLCWILAQAIRLLH